MITRNMIKKGLEQGIIEIIDSPHENGAVCRIGQYWFYFGGQTAEDMSAEEFLANVPVKDIIDEIYETLYDMRDDETFIDELDYYEVYLRENLEREPSAQIPPEIEKIWNVPLHDDESPYGGISFEGETVGDFVEESFQDVKVTFRDLNEALKECGIKPVPLMSELKLRKICMDNGFFNAGTNEQYDKLFKRLNDGADRHELANMIWFFSNDNVLYETILSALSSRRTMDKDGISADFRNDVRRVLSESVGWEYANEIAEYGDDWFYDFVEDDVESTSGFQETGRYNTDDIRLAIGRAILRLLSE